MKDIELEIQVQVENSKELLAFLEEQGEFKGEKHQLDEYYTPPDRDFSAVRPTKEWLRIREANGKYSINYKNWQYDEHGKDMSFCDEYESEVQDGESVRKILQVLNFRKLITVDKMRKIWNYEEYEVAIDSVKDLGDFVEIEYRGIDAAFNSEKIVAEMIQFLKGRNCGKIYKNSVGYPFMLLYKDEVKLETF